MNAKNLTQAIKSEATHLGFDLVGIAPHSPPPHANALDDWVGAGYAGEMHYMDRAIERRKDPRVLFPEGHSIIVVGKHYRMAELLERVWRDPSRARIARYAWGADYHDVLLPRLHQLVEFIEAQTERSLRAREYVDTGALLERPVAVAAGLGFIGRNTLLIHPRQGSFLFLSEILVDLELEPNLDPARVSCGTCTRCLQICPTNAFVAPYVLDARLCIAYLTIEYKGPIPRELRPLMGNRIFGCDDCQEVCPWNIRFGASGDAEFFKLDPDRIAPPLLDLISLDDDAFRKRFAKTPLTRSKRRGLLRNVAVAIGNWGDPQTVPALVNALRDAEPLIRGHAAWALGRISSGDAHKSLSQRWAIEEDAWVREEIQVALEN